MNEKELMRKVTGTFETLGIPYFITGGMASIAYSEPRYTHDIDVVADIPDSLVPALLGEYPAPDYYLSAPAMREAIRRRSQFNIIHITSGLKVDVMLPSRNEYDRLRMSRIKRLQTGSDTEGWFASPEDVILKKLVFFQSGGSEKHLRDIASMLLISGSAIDQEYVTQWARKLGVASEWQLVGERLGEAGA